MLGEFLNRNPVPIKFMRQEEGVYLFGTKRINIKIQKGRLLCRVGGGFLYIDEFIKLYTVTELIKMKQTKNYDNLVKGSVPADPTSTLPSQGPSGGNLPVQAKSDNGA